MTPMYIFILILLAIAIFLVGILAGLIIALDTPPTRAGDWKEHIISTEELEIPIPEPQKEKEEERK